MPTFTAKAGLKLLAGVVLAFALFFALRSCMTKDARTEAASAKADASLSDARAAAGKAAIESVDNAATREDATHQITKENADEIHTAPGAPVPVDPAIDHVARVGLCRYAAYRDSEQCKRLLSAGAE